MLPVSTLTGTSQWRSRSGKRKTATYRNETSTIFVIHRKSTDLEFLIYILYRQDIRISMASQLGIAKAYFSVITRLPCVWPIIMQSTQCTEAASSKTYRARLRPMFRLSYIFPLGEHGTSGGPALRSLNSAKVPWSDAGRSDRNCRGSPASRNTFDGSKGTNENHPNVGRRSHK